MSEINYTVKYFAKVHIIFEKKRNFAFYFSKKMSATDKLLEVNNLTVSFRDEKKGLRKVVDGVSYRLERGQTLGIVGESGSGKTVSTLALMGLLPESTQVSGSAIFGSEKIDLLGLKEEEFRSIRGRRISMIFQEPMTSLNPVQKCGAQVVEMLMCHGSALRHAKCNKKEARQRAIDLFKEVMLPRPEKIFDSYPHEISGGQKQRVMIAMALVNNPDIIIADEPTTALDVTVQKSILELLRRLQKRHGISIIFITHDLGVIAQIADEILVMYQGKVVEQGAAYSILHSPQHPYTQNLLASRPSKRSTNYAREDVQSSTGASDPAPTANHPSKANGQQPTANSQQPIANVDAAGMPPLLSVRNLNVEYVLKKSLLGRPLQKLKAVDGISFDLYRGETLGLVGESGCGKTTLGRALLRLIESRSEQITFDGQRLDKMTEREMRRLRTKMQIIFQDPYSSLNPRLTVGEAICEPLRVHQIGSHQGPKAKSQKPKAQKEQVIELMERVGLKAEWYDRYPHQFSGGQRQRICIARALILNPELVICDESVSALDVTVQAQVLKLLNELKEQFGYTYIFISHDLEVVHSIADRIMVMRGGRMVEMGDTETVYNTPADPYTRTLLEAIPRIEN